MEKPEIRLLTWDNTTNYYDEGADDNKSFGVQIAFDDLWNAMAFISLIWIMGLVSEKLLFMPSLVGQIFAGIIFGPEVVQLISPPFDKAFVLLGEMGLTLFVLEAGVNMDFETLKLIGLRGAAIAVFGSIMPIAIAFGIASALVGSRREAIAAAASFGPTSFGITMNILQHGNIIQSPTGQLVVAAAIIDDMIAIIILSQLEALVGSVSISSILIPIVSSLLFLVVGGLVALFLMPRILKSYIFTKKETSVDKRTRIGLIVMFAMLMGMMKATHSAKASHLMGAFLVGLVFCRDDDMRVLFSRQFKRMIQWLMRIFFASTIGFQVPIKQFSDAAVLWKGFIFALSLSGKMLVGLLVPNFTNQPKRFTGSHLRDCLIVGCSMAAEGEFAFVIATFGVNAGILDEKLYASVVLAILLSAVVSPFLLRFIIRFFHPAPPKDNDEMEERSLEENIEEIHQESLMVEDSISTSPAGS
eukprot:CAMPEP_0176484780 /NCGR_PEP_ID=MMETSP0200_2-20121128/4647_1 /TAXON_ID=947934 /ORGANISM="Chaetoceros sp., Strain GSL56" /LENGTH=471 /DNA_ID=CAMNT_0017881297 /DNA_START=97 /DNA_END=1512 /DNA_ORIENTATION=-